MLSHIQIKPYWRPVGGWGPARSVTEILLREGVYARGSVAPSPSRFCALDGAVKILPINTRMSTTTRTRPRRLAGAGPSRRYRASSVVHR